MKTSKTRKSLDAPARLLAILSELSIEELRLMMLFVDWLAAGTALGKGEK